MGDWLKAFQAWVKANPLTTAAAEQEFARIVYLGAQRGFRAGWEARQAAGQDAPREGS